MLELRALRSFAMLAEELHFGRAADRLGIAQPALSQQIKRLERIVGAELFDRTSKRVSLTAVGATLLDETRVLLPLADRALVRTERVARGDAGTLRVGFVASGAFSVLPDILRTFRREYPAVHLELVEGVIDTPLARLEAGLIDVALLRGPVTHPRIRFEPVFREPLCAVLPKRHRFAKRAIVPLKALLDEPFVMFPRFRAPEFYDAIIDECRSAGLTPRIVQEASEWQVLASFVAAELGVTLAPESVRRMPRDGVVFRSIRPRRAIAELIVAYADNTSPPLVEAFIQVARAVGNLGRRR
jgi:DNA-binding transcriptional LysR family regulator